MRKISFFYSFAALLFASVSMAVVPAHAQELQKFCVDKPAGTGVLRLYQMPSLYNPTGNSGEKCYASWISVSTAINEWVENLGNQVNGATIEISSDLEFAGISAANGACLGGVKSFSGKMLDLKNVVSLVGTSSDPFYKISGLCYQSSNESDVGFVKGAAKVSNLEFDNAFFKSSKASSSVGIVAKNESNGSSVNHVYQNIIVSNSEFSGYYAGAVLGYGSAYISDISLKNVVIHGGNYAGGVVGFFNAENLNSFGAAADYAYSKFNIENLKIVKESSFNANETYFGGIAGYVSQSSQKDWTQISITDLDIQNASYAGGLLGWVYYLSSQVADDTKFYEIFVGKKDAAKSVINATKYAGGLVGYINEGSVAGSSVAVHATSVNADVQGSTKDGSDSYVGGLIGFINFSSSGNMVLTIDNNNIVGDVYGAGDDKKVGYLVGSMDRKVVDFESVKYNYHYGDYATTGHYAKIGIGSFNDDGDNWLNPKANAAAPVITHNFRNDVSGDAVILKKDGDLVADAAQPVKSSTASYYNGIIGSDNMKTSAFAAALNSGNTSANNTAVWVDGKTDLPYLNTNVVVSNNDYHLIFNMDDVEKIKQTFADNIITGKYSIYVRNGFNSPEKTYDLYNMNMSNDSLPMLHAVTDAYRDDSYQNDPNPPDSSFDAYWTLLGGDSDDYSHCKIGSTVLEGSVFVPYCADSQLSFNRFGSDLIEQAEDKGKMLTGKKMNLYPVWKPVDEGISTIEVKDVNCSSPSSIYDCLERPLDLVLSQTATMNGKEYKFTHSTADKNADGVDGVILLPHKGSYTFDVDFVVNPGFEFKNPWKGTIDGVDTQDPNHFEIRYKQDEKKLYIDDNSAAAPVELVYELPLYTFVDYKVNFDLSNFVKNKKEVPYTKIVSENGENVVSYSGIYVEYNDEYMVFGNAWAENDWLASKTMNIAPKSRVFPKAYAHKFNSQSNPVFQMLGWGYDASRRETYDQLTSSLLKKALGDDWNQTEVNLYAVDGNKGSVIQQTIEVRANGEVEKLKEDFHGSLELSQTINSSENDDGIKFVQKSHFFMKKKVGSDSYYVQNLYVPNAAGAFADTLTYNVSTNPDLGYEMEVSFNHGWTSAPAAEGWGYNAAKQTLKYLPSKMNSSYFSVQYKPLTYVVKYSIPDELLEKGVFVANTNNGTTVANSDMDWLEGPQEVTINNITAPTIYTVSNSQGVSQTCRVGWIVEGDNVLAHEAGPIENEIAYMTSKKANSKYVNTLVPEVNYPVCESTSKPYKITLNINDGGKGNVSLMQKLPNGGDDTTVVTHSFKEDANKKLVLEIPQVKYGSNNAVTAVALLIDAVPAEGYVLDDISYKKSTGVAAEPITAQNGDKIVVNGDMELNVTFTKLEPVYVAYDLSLENKASDSANTYLPVGATNKESIQLNSPTDVYTLWKPYRKDMCFGGWSLIKPNGTQTSNNPVLNEFSYSYLGDFSKDESKPTMLYAIWNDCQSNPKPTISVGTSSANMTLVLYQVFGKDTLRHEMEQFGITLNGEAFDFYIDTVRSVPAVGYVIDHSKYALSYKVQGQSIDYIVKSENNAWRVTPEIKETGTVTARTYTFTPTVKKVTYELVFNENAGSEKQFFGDSWKDILTEATFDADNDGNWTVKQAWTVNTTERKFPMAIYREGYCLQGYTLAKNDKTEGVWTELTDVFMQNYAKLAASGSIPMYAYWEACDQGFTVYAVDADKGTLTLSRTFDIGGSDKKAVRTYEVGANGLKIPSVNNDVSFTEISFETKKNANVIFDTDKNYTFREHGGTGEWNEFNGFMTVTSDLDIQVPLFMDLFNSTYVLDMNATDVFYGDGFDAFTWTAVAFGDKLPTNIYRTDAVLAGWSFEQNATPDKAITVFDKKFVEIFESYENASQFGVNFDPTKKTYPVLFAVWETSVVPTWTVKADQKNKGLLTLEQSVGGKSFVHAVDKEVLVPATDGIEFFVRYEPGNNWELAGGEALIWKDANGNEHATENESFQRIDNDYVVSALENAKEFNLVFDATLEGSLYYGGDWAMEYDKVAGDEAKAFPTMAYSDDRCLAGWSVTPDGSIYKEMNHALVEEIYAAYPNLDEKTKVKLYDRWTDDVQSCAGNFTQVAVKSEHGSIELIEKTEKGNIVHKFDGKGKVLVPSEIDSVNWSLHVVPDAGYVLDSLVVTKNKNVVAVLHDGSKLPKDMENVVFAAYFGKENKTAVAIVDENFQWSGNTLQFDFVSSAFDPERTVSASIKIIDMQTGKPVKDTVLSNSIESAFSDKVTVRVVKPGTYKVVLTLSDGDETDERTEYLTVRSPFDSVKPGSWNMLSYNALDLSEISWNDTRFYWWDEGGIGEYWQYKSIHSGDTLSATQGVWLSSKSDKPLVLRSDYTDDGSDIVWDLESKNSGWNLVANPHGWYVDLYSYNRDKRTNADEESEIEFWRYNPETGAYDENIEILGPYEAVWVHVTKKTKWIVSAEPVYVNDLQYEYREDESIDLEYHNDVHGRVLAKSAAKDKWTLQLALSDDNGKRDSWNLLGVSDHPFDAEEPPASMGDHVNLSIVDGNRGLAKSIKAPGDDLEWTVALTASSIRNGYLTLAGIDGVKSLGYKVYVTVDGETTEMQEGKALPVLLKSSSKTATVRVSKGAPVMAKKSLIKELRWTGVGNKLQVSFEAPESLAGANARVELLDVKGKVKATVAAKTLWGSNALVLDAPQSGLHILRVRVGSEQQVRKIHVK